MLSIIVTAVKNYQVTKEVEQFYKQAPFIPAPSKINLCDAKCVARIADDMRLFGKNQKIIKNLLTYTTK